MCARVCVLSRRTQCPATSASAPGKSEGVALAAKTPAPSNPKSKKEVSKNVATSQPSGKKRKNEEAASACKRTKPEAKSEDTGLSYRASFLARMNQKLSNSENKEEMYTFLQPLDPTGRVPKQKGRLVQYAYDVLHEGVTDESSDESVKKAFMNTIKGANPAKTRRMLNKVFMLKRAHKIQRDDAPRTIQKQAFDQMHFETDSEDDSDDSDSEGSDSE